MRSWIALAVVAATLGGAGLSAYADEAPRTISVTGTGEISVEPDMATVVVGIQAESDVAANALDQASAATAAILATLDVEGIDPTQIRSGSVRLRPRYSSSALSDGTSIVGYQAINTVEVIVNDLDRLGGLLAAVVGDGANRLDGVRFGLQDPTAATDEARRRAVAEGARLAALYAEAAGVSVGDLLSLSEHGSGGYRMVTAEPVMLEMAGASPQYDVPIAAGQIELNASISMVYAIGE